MNNNLLSEIRRLHELGMAIHWVKPSSKIPVKSGWGKSKRDNLETLLKEYQKGYNIGTKLGETSKVGDKYLAVLDVDVKGTEKKHKDAAISWINENFPALMDSAPITLSGRGNGSMHIWVLVDRPADSRTLYSSNEEVEVYMPSAKSTNRQLEILGQEKIDAGIRFRPSFEIDFMCVGRQVVWVQPLYDGPSLGLF